MNPRTTRLRRQRRNERRERRLERDKETAMVRRHQRSQRPFLRAERVELQTITQTHAAGSSTVRWDFVRQACMLRLHMAAEGQVAAEIGHGGPHGLMMFTAGPVPLELLFQETYSRRAHGLVPTSMPNLPFTWMNPGDWMHFELEGPGGTIIDVELRGIEILRPDEIPSRRSQKRGRSPGYLTAYAGAVYGRP
jgi:hypothetical protein